MNSGLCRVDNPSLRNTRLSSYTRSKPPTNKPLQVELRRDTQVERRVERIVMRHERPRRRAARERLHHRRLDLGEVERIEETADEADQHAAAAEHLARLLAHDQVDIALPQLHLGIRDAVPLFRQRPQRLRQQAQLGDVDRQLAGLRLDELAARRNDVAHVPLLELAIRRLAEAIALEHELNLPGAVLELHEARAAHDALDHQAARQRSR